MPKPPQNFWAIALVIAALRLGLASAAAKVKPPPNTIVKPFAVVQGTTLASEAYWNLACSKVPVEALYLMLDMGGSRDFFKPGDGATVCEMLKSRVLHQWSPDGLGWLTPEYDNRLESFKHPFEGSLGGSLEDWPRDNVAREARKYLPIWGSAVTMGGCCSASNTYFTGWGQTFTFSHGMSVHVAQPPPPNTVTTVFAAVSSTQQGTDAYWATVCQSVPAGATFLLLQMGLVRDYFRPTADDVTMCAMLTSNNLHEWSPNGVDWEIPRHNAGITNGGSGTDWPKQNKDGDGRSHLSTWGTTGGQMGGCCSSTYLEDVSPGWGHPFSLSFGMQVAQPPPPGTAITVFATVDDKTKADDKYWSETCLQVPEDTSYLMLDMGTVRDFFKPIGGASWCEMLAGYTKHEWSPNGIDWVIPKYTATSTIRGGSYQYWLQLEGTSNGGHDARQSLSFWGVTTNHLGGCCSSAYSEFASGWGHPFQLAYGVPLQVAQPPPSGTVATVFATVQTNTHANAEFWTKECQEIPASASYLMLRMGDVHDFFKPVDGASWCEMLVSNTLHQWSMNGIDWKTPAYKSGGLSKSGLYLGGSADQWPAFNVDGDPRVLLSLWGSPAAKGGCCLTTYSSGSIGGENNFPQAFTFAYGVPLQVAQPPPPGTFATVFAIVTAVEQANDAYWTTKCQEIPASASYVMLDMGMVRDFFKPVDGASWCEMLVSNTLHQWSMNGIDWKTPQSDLTNDLVFNGGSVPGWPKQNMEGDERMFISMWGGENCTGGCCSASYKCYYEAEWPSQPFSMAYGSTTATDNNGMGGSATPASIKPTTPTTPTTTAEASDTISTDTTDDIDATTTPTPITQTIFGNDAEPTSTPTTTADQATSVLDPTVTKVGVNATVDTTKTGSGGIVAAVVAVVLLLSVVGGYVWWRRKQQHELQHQARHDELHGGGVVAMIVNPLRAGKPAGDDVGDDAGDDGSVAAGSASRSVVVQLTDNPMYAGAGAQAPEYAVPFDPATGHREADFIPTSAPPADDDRYSGYTAPETVFQPPVNDTDGYRIDPTSPHNTDNDATINYAEHAPAGGSSASSTKVDASASTVATGGVEANNFYDAGVPTHTAAGRVVPGAKGAEANNFYDAGVPTHTNRTANIGGDLEEYAEVAEVDLQTVVDAEEYEIMEMTQNV
jgi:hypothetical protein